MSKAQVFLYFIAFAFSMQGAAQHQVFIEDFENPQSARKYKQESNFTIGKFAAINPGHLSKTCLAADKPDNCGNMVYRMPIPIPAGLSGDWIEISADIKTGRVGPESEYFLMVTQLEKGKSNGPNIFLNFDDGISRPSKFGNLCKTPQTSGKWKKTFHQIQLRKNTDQVILSIVINGGNQEIYFDNITVEDLGKTKPPPKIVPVFAERIDWPYAFIELDNLIPGCVYSIQTDISWPGQNAEKEIKGLTPNASKSAKLPPDDMSGMGIGMSFSDLSGKKSAPEQLNGVPDDHNKKTFRLVVPQNAVKVYLDLHNDDLIRFDHNQIEYQARRWQNLKIYLENYGEIAADNAFSQYIYRNRPANLKPANLQELDDFDLEVLKEKLRVREQSDLKIIKYKNGICFILDGKPIPPLAAAGLPEVFLNYGAGNLSSTGIKVIIAPMPYGGIAMHGDWKGNGNYDFSDLDMSVYRILNQNPDAVIILSVDCMYPPAWWGKENPDELVKDQNGDTAWSNDGYLYNWHFGKPEELFKSFEAQTVKSDHMYQKRGAKWVGTFVPSTASEKYRKAMADYLGAMCRHIEKQPYDKAVAGYRMIWGYDGQWGNLYPLYGYDNKGTHCPDFSSPMLKYFRNFLKDKYKTDDALRKAWKDEKTSLETAVIPGPERRNLDQMKTDSYLLDPSRYQDVIDFRKCEAKSTASLLLDFCKTVKKASSRKVLTLAYYPDIAENSSGRPSNRANDMVYESNDLDGVVGPTYAARETGQGSRSNCLLSSVTLHGKLHMNELDHRVFPVVKRNYANNLLFDTPEKSISVLRREYMRQMCFGTGSWTLDMGYGWFSDPLISEIIMNANEVFGKVIEHDRESIAQMAIFIGDYGKDIQADGRRGAIPLKLVSTAIVASSQAGVPIDQYIIDDLPLVYRKYKVFFFPFAYGLTRDEILNIEKLKKNGNILIFGFGAGYVSDKLSIESAEKLTGFRMGLEPSLDLTLKLENNEHPILEGIKDHFIGSAGLVEYQKGMPGIFIDDPQAVVLGKFTGNGKAGFAVKDYGSWKSIYIGAIGNFPPEIFRNIAGFAGLHVYNDDCDVMFFNKSLIGIHASSDGIKTIKLPFKADVTSLWDNKKTGKIDTIKRPMKTGENALYLIEK